MIQQERYGRLSKVAGLDTPLPPRRGRFKTKTWWRVRWLAWMACNGWCSWCGHWIGSLGSLKVYRPLHRDATQRVALGGICRRCIAGLPAKQRER